jgi:hypothetical protein
VHGFEEVGEFFGVLRLGVDEGLGWCQGCAWRSEELRRVANVQGSDLRSTSGARSAAGFL